MDLSKIKLPRAEEPQALAESVAIAIENAIIVGELAEGARLTEEIICKRTGISRSPIREALRIVEYDGLAKREIRKGVRVSFLSLEDLDELYACRVPLETAAARLAAKNASGEELHALSDMQSRCARLFMSNDISGHFWLNVEISQLIFQMSRNNRLVQLLASIHKPALRYRYYAYSQSTAARKNSVQRNSMLVAALVARDSERSAVCIEKTINTSHKIIRDFLLKRPA